ncbi:hypothetical protein BS17DRAFT_780857 [Gyrodon lividus]|nr:hypothetical protein BS17DRAFT_780857 [Gyrodon lividus]
MPRRTSNRTVTSSFATPQAPSVVLQLLETPYDSNIHQLRRHWKWAAFCQFFFTFNALLAMNDVTLIDVEDDLAHSTNRVLSRIMQRLLITVTQDRKITVDNWQNALRRQYSRRDPEANPIGPMSQTQPFLAESSRASTAPPVRSHLSSEAPLDEENDKDSGAPERDHSAEVPSLDDPSDDVEGLAEDPQHKRGTTVEIQETVPDTLEEPEKQINWLDLPMFTKLESLHTLVEWQFQNAHRLRQQMKSDDEQAAWRIEPIGYDAKRNAYWLIGGDRLWIQRELPRVNLKRKRKPEGSGDTRKAGKKRQMLSHVAKRPRIDPKPSTVEHPSPATPYCPRKLQTEQSPGSRGRAAKTRANQRLDAQAKDLAEFQRQMASSSRTAGAAAQTPRRPAGIRVSARLRGTVVEEDEWQEVPEEWLATSDQNKSKDKRPQPNSSPAGQEEMKIGLESDGDSVSDLTELSDDTKGEAEGEADVDDKTNLVTEEVQPPSAQREMEVVELIDGHTEVESGGQQDEQPKAADQDMGEDSPPPLPEDFVEWETICVTVEEWENIGQHFEKATHYAEKALHKILSQNIVPVITTELKEIEKKRRMEEAVVHRKRSSRIAMKETEKEEERAAIRRRVEDEEKMSRARRLEARQQKEQAEQLKRENAREQRRKERELREHKLAVAREANSKAEATADTVGRVSSPTTQHVGQVTDSITLSAAPMNGAGSGSRTPVENWELDCEICGRRGFNQDDGVPIMCCGMCTKWQHIICHDKQDAMAGRPKRNWDAEDFVCQSCRLRKSRDSSSSSSAGILPVGVNNTKGYVSGTQPYYGQSEHHPRNYPNNSYYQDTPPTGRYPYEPQSDVRPSAPLHSSQSYLSQSRSGGVTFAHYQPQQGGFSTSRPTYSVQDGTQPQQARYSHSISPHPVPAIGATPHSSFHSHSLAHAPPAHAHEQWQPSSSYPRASNATNGTPALLTQGVEPYYIGHTNNGVAHMQYSQVRTANSQTMGQYSGFQQATPYQQSK